MFTVSGSPVTSSGTLTAVLADQPATYVLAGPTSGSPAPSNFRALVATDIPAITEAQVTGLTADLATKADKATTVTATAPLTGSGTLGGNLTLAIVPFSTVAAGAVAASGSATKFIRGDNTAADAVTSVGLSMPAEFTVSSSPVTTTGTLTVTKANETENTIYAGPATNPAAAPTFRSMVVADVPALPESKITNLVSDLAALTPLTRTINTTAPLNGGGNLVSDLTLGLTLNGSGCLSTSGGLGIATGCITDAMLSPSAGFVKRDGSTQLTNSWNIGPENLGLNVTTPTYGWHQRGGGMREEFVPTPGAPTVTPQGTAGVTNYSYQIVAIDHNGGKTLVGPTGATSTGNATLTPTNFNHITWTAVSGASTYDVTINGTSTSVATNISTTFFDDIGGTQNPYTAPARNSTADLTVDGQLTADVQFTGPITVPGSVTATQYISNIATGTAPLVVTSTTPVANLTLASDTQLPTISTAGKVSNSATTGTASNTPSTLVLRDGSGNFAAGAITASLTGNVTGNVSGTAGSFTGALVGDVTGVQSATVVSLVGTSTAANVHAAELLANAATSANTVSAIVRRDASGNFSATSPTFSGQINSTIVTGTAPMVVASTTPVANLALLADSQLPTISTALKVSNSATTATSTNTASAIVARDGSGNFAAGTETLAGQLISSLAIGTAPFSITSTTAVANLTLAADTQLPTISTAGKVSNSATTGTAANTASTLVLRDGSGNFAAGAVTGTQFVGPATALSTNGGASAVSVVAASPPAAGEFLVASDATHAVWKDVSASGGVPTTRTITTTAPLTIDAGASADLSANRTLAIAITPTNNGGAVALQSTTPGVTQNPGHFNVTGTGLVNFMGVGSPYTDGGSSPIMFLSVASHVEPPSTFSNPNGSFGSAFFMGDSLTPGGLTIGSQHHAGLPTTINDNMGGVEWTGEDNGGSGTDFQGRTDASIEVRANQSFTATAHGTHMDFYTTPNGAITSVKGLTLEANGTVTVPVGPLVVGSGTAALATGLDVNGPVATRHGSVTLANGLNSDVTMPAFSFVRFSGPTGAYSLGGLTAGVDGQIAYLYFTASQTATIVNEDVSSTAANRIKTLTGADVVLRTTLPAFVTLIYDTVTSRWVVVSVN
jgi:hypothetical protein